MRTQKYFDFIGQNSFFLTKDNIFLTCRNRMQQNLRENWVSKKIIFVLILTTATKFIFRNKTFLFLKIESWNFQHLFENEFRETSQNFNSIRQPIETIQITIIWISWMSWHFVRFQEIEFQTDAESFSFLSWERKKVLFLKKRFFKPYRQDRSKRWRLLS